MGTILALFVVWQGWPQIARRIENGIQQFISLSVPGSSSAGILALPRLRTHAEPLPPARSRPEKPFE